MTAHVNPHWKWLELRALEITKAITEITERGLNHHNARLAGIWSRELTSILAEAQEEWRVKEGVERDTYPPVEGIAEPSDPDLKMLSKSARHLLENATRWETLCEAVKVYPAVTVGEIMSRIRRSEEEPS